MKIIDPAAFTTGNYMENMQYLLIVKTTLAN